MKLPNVIRIGLETLAVAYTAAASAKTTKRIPPHQLSVPIPSQDTVFWCWAAVASVIAEFYGNSTFPQHVVAGGVLGKKCQPNGAMPPDCNCGAALSDALCVTDNHWATVTGSYSFADVHRAFKGNRPLCARGEDITPSSNQAGHFVVIFGYSTDGNDLVIGDPAAGLQYPTFRQFVKGYRGIYKWESTYETKSHKDPPHCKFVPEVPPC